MMDAVEFAKEVRRMCLSHTGVCGVCGAWNCNENVCKVDFYDDQFDPAEAVRMVEEWSKAHPIQTNEDKLKEVFGPTWVADVWHMDGDDFWRWLHEPYEGPKGEKGQ